MQLRRRIQELAGGYWRAYVTDERGVVVDGCTHRHRSQLAATTCATAMTKREATKVVATVAKARTKRKAKKKAA